MEQASCSTRVARGLALGARGWPGRYCGAQRGCRGTGGDVRCSDGLVGSRRHGRRQGQSDWADWGHGGGRCGERASRRRSCQGSRRQGDAVSVLERIKGRMWMRLARG
ncbi:hypothetical protein L1887_60854 [Cichorium endivia]|nr:hypothetical protein L1887_60854 [Cichorium endivia]